MHLLDISCMSVGIFFEIACYISQQVAPVLTRVVVVPVASVAASSTAEATVAVLGAAAEVLIAECPELLAVVGVVAVHVVEDADRVAALG